MKKGFWVSIVLLATSLSLFANTPTMSYSAQPAGTVSTLPTSFTIQNGAPIPQDICSAEISAAGQTATCSGLPICRGGSTHQASFSCTVTTTCGTTVSASQNGGNCSISLNVTKPSTLAATTAFTFKLGYGSYSTVLASNAFKINGTNPLPPSDSHRTITFKNSCNIPIWFGTITGAAPTKNVLSGGTIDCTGGSGNAGKLACVAAGGACYSRAGQEDACLSQVCTSDSDCMKGASCHAATGKCYWNNPSPTNGNFELATSGPGSTNTIEIPEYTSNGIGIVWSGAFGGRTGCTTGACISGLCTIGTENAQGVCSLGAGFQQPATQAEPTFITYPTGTTPVAPTDAYDVTVINGANLPISMYPTPPTSLPSAGENPFTCGAPGYNQAVPSGDLANNTIGASSWNVSGNQGNLAFRYVVSTTSPAPRCAADSDCSGGQKCGLNYSAQSIGSTVAPGTGQLVCGEFAGWFTADQICGTNNNFTTAVDKNGVEVRNFRCNTPVALGTMSNLYQCNGNYGVSCYSSTSSNCCGCVDWGTQGTVLPVPTNGTVNICQGTNTSWTQSFGPTQPQVYDTVFFLKKSCPSCYVYPFDDASSSFTCTTGSTTANNTQAYTVEFCPGGNGKDDFQP